MNETGIEWTEVTWNPVTGCDRISPGCDNCYALTLAPRLKAMGSKRYQKDGTPPTSGPGFGVSVHEDLIRSPLSWKKPRLVFVNSMSDLFHAHVPDDVISRIFTTMQEADAHTFQVLTKRSLRLRRLSATLPWPENVWMGVSVESADQLFRVDHLRDTPAALRFLSLEPLLGPLTLDLTGIDWVILGGESGPSARPLDPAWVRSVRDQCVEAGVPFFFKQWGGLTPKSGGKDLDGTTWTQMPARTAP